MTPPFKRVLVANRGEIALRIIRACHELGMEAVAVYSDADAGSAHVRAADAAVRLGPAPAPESYLRIDAVVEAGVSTGCEAVHPGYGFLAERAAFAQAVEDAGMVFVGPHPAAIAALGDKLAARRAATAAEVPVVPGTLEPAPVDNPEAAEQILQAAEKVGFPLLVKAAAGGGGRGMRRVDRKEDLLENLLAGSREAASAFGDGSVYIERMVLEARHIEVQLLGDATGKVVAIGERDCSLQRRHQKLLEEAPAPGLTEEQRRRLHGMAERVASAAGLQNAATGEFLFDRDGNFWFLEVNTRLQVEHGVTEMVAGLDIVAEQFWLAAGRPLSERALDAAARAATPTKAAIEVRLSAEDPSRAFAPTPGRVTRWRLPAGPGVRIDTAIEEGDRVPQEYDPMIAKLLVEATDRPAAIARLRRALDELEVCGIQTTLPFHRFIARNEDFAAARISTAWVGDHYDAAAERGRAVHAAALAAGLSTMAEGGSATTGRTVTPARGVQPAATAASAWRIAGREAAIDRWPR